MSEHGFVLKDVGAITFRYQGEDPSAVCPKSSDGIHCAHIEGMGSTHFTGGNQMYRCCHCGEYANVTWHSETYRPEGHGEYAREGRVIWNWPEGWRDATAPSESSPSQPPTGRAMSRASERKAMSDTLAAYSLMSVQEVAKLLRCSEVVAKEMIDAGEIPSIPVGKRRKVDPIDAVVHLLAGREGVTSSEYWEIHGEAVPELVREYYHRIRVMQGAA